ncbi:MAG: tRNA lysidine(34) synthetase TilS, partial [Bacillota bacterium]|nr:tRNA lysidine(34) synthetase TilS [Bacillota bacterium]
DARFVEDLGRRLGLPVTVGVRDALAYARANGLSVEAGAREVRYAFLREVAEEVGAQRIALGHTADDQVETVLWRFLRGAGLRGLGGMQPVREGRYIRPLFYLWRSEVEEYCRRWQLNPVLDSSNLEPAFLRNRIRLHLLPLLEREYNPALRRRLWAVSEVWRAEDAFLEEVTAQALRGALIPPPEWVRRWEPPPAAVRALRLATVESWPAALRRRALRRLAAELLPEGKELELSHVEAILALLEGRGAGGRVALPGGLRVERGYEELVLARLPAEGPSHGTREEGGFFALPLPGRVDLPGGRAITAQVWEVGDQLAGGEGPWWSLIRTAPPQVAYLDADRVFPPLRVRFRSAGDRFFPLGLKAAKKVKEFFIDAKVPRAERPYIPLVEDAKKIIWVAGYRLDERVRVTEETRRLLRLEVLDAGNFTVI